ncbi:MAG: hypothetical protein C0404_01535 [Verrucomicrobia bacterium]|nr:hypothetical protein [Verrucomicrobiota bacterium]
MSAETKICAKCRFENAADAAFCENCGGELTAAVAPAPEPLPEPVPVEHSFESQVALPEEDTALPPGPPSEMLKSSGPADEPRATTRREKQPKSTVSGLAREIGLVEVQLRRAPDKAGSKVVRLMRKGEGDVSSVFIHCCDTTVFKENFAGRTYSDLPVKTAGKLVVSCQAGNARHCSSWELGRKRATQPLVNIKGGGIVQQISIETDGGVDDSPVVIEEAGAVMGGITIKRKEQDPSVFDQVFPQVSEKADMHPEWLVTQPMKQLTLYCGGELTMGIDHKTDWRVFSRQSCGGIVGYDAQRRKVVIAEAEVPKRPDLRYPISHFHASLQWHGGNSVRLMNGKDRPSKRGLFLGDGLLVDPGCWTTRALPLKVFLGTPGEENTVEIELVGVKTSSGSTVVCARQSGGGAPDHLLVWQADGVPFAFAASHTRHWYPTWFETEGELTVKHKHAEWIVHGRDEEKGRPCPAVKGDKHAIDKAVYRVRRTTGSLIEFVSV